MRQTPSSDTTYLFLLRHGATPANEQRPYILQGKGINRGLSECGRRQAQAVGQFFRDFAIHHVYSSPMVRAFETAKEVARHHSLDVTPLELLVECHVGHWEGMDWETIMREFPEEYRAFMANPGEVCYLGGESYGDVLRRVRPIFQELLERHTGEAIVVVAHNVVNRVYLADLLKMDLRLAKDIRQVNTGINVIRYRKGETSLVTMNAAFHLDEVE